LHVSAKDKATGREQKITITASSGLSKDEVDRMVKEAQRFSDEDRRRREEVEARNNADSLIYQAEKLLRDQGDKAPGAMKSEVEGKVAAVRSALQGKDTDRIRQTTQELSEALQRLGASMYSQQTPPPPGGEAGPAGGAGGEDVVDGEFREA